MSKLDCPDDFNFWLLKKKRVTDWSTDHPTNGRTDTPSYRDGWTHLKIYKCILAIPALYWCHWCTDGTTADTILLGLTRWHPSSSSYVWLPFSSTFLCAVIWKDTLSVIFHLLYFFDMALGNFDKKVVPIKGNYLLTGRQVCNGTMSNKLQMNVRVLNKVIVMSLILIFM